MKPDCVPGYNKLTPASLAVETHSVLKPHEPLPSLFSFPLALLSSKFSFHCSMGFLPKSSYIFPPFHLQNKTKGLEPHSHAYPSNGSTLQDQLTCICSFSRSRDNV